MTEELQNLSQPVSPTPDIAAFMSTSSYRTCDTLIALLLLLCLFIGLPGNLLSFLFYTKRSDFPSLIYSVVCGVDVITSVIHIPVMFSLFDFRKPGLFSNEIFCVAWNVVLYFQARMSMFLVMVLSVSRTIAIVYPFYRMSKKVFLVSLALFTLYICLWNTLLIPISQGNLYFGYDHVTVYCYYVFNDGFGILVRLELIEQIFYMITIGVPPLLTLISFLKSITKLANKNSSSNMSKRNRKASVTLAAFTALFLICNLPCFLNNLVFTAGFLQGVYPRPYYMSTFMFFYSWVLAEVVSVVVNAALNPVLYYYRVKKLRIWTISLLIRRFGTRAQQSRHSTAEKSRISVLDPGTTGLNPH